MKLGYAGYLLDENQRLQLAQIFIPKFKQFVGHHITTAFNVTEQSIPAAPTESLIVGYTADDGLEALVVAINGSTERIDGRTFHITWSLIPEIRKPVDANKLIETVWYAIAPIAIKVEPKFFEFAGAK